MKKLIGILGIFIFVNGAFISCSDDDSPNEPGITTPIESAEGTYLGTENNTGKFKILLHAAEGDFQLNFVSDPITNDNLLEAELKSTKYTVSQVATLYSITTDSHLAKGNAQSKIVSGELTVNRSEETYAIKGTLTDEQNISYKVDFKVLIDIEPVYDIQYDKQNGWYWGDQEYDHPNIAEYMAYFAQGETDKYGELVGDGYYISLSFYNDMAPKAWEAKIPNQTYIASSEYKVGSFRIATQQDIEDGAPYYAFASFKHNNSKEGIAKEVFITDGSVKVMDKKDDQEVRFNFELQDGSRHVGKYTGKVRQGDEYTVTTLTTDRQVGQLDHGYIEYKGKSPIAGKENNRWDIYILNQNVTTYPEYYWASEGTGDFMRITLYTPTEVTTEISAGTYPIGEENAGNAGLGAGSEIGLEFGTWFFEMKNDDFTNYAPIKTGSVIVAKNNEVYTITLEGMDDRQNMIKANYSGELTFINSASSDATSSKVKKAQGKENMYNWKKNSKATKAFTANLDK
ncbi:hypothetical protein D3C87_126180 [compost metagenome]